MGSFGLEDVVWILIALFGGREMMGCGLGLVLGLGAIAGRGQPGGFEERVKK